MDRSLGRIIAASLAAAGIGIWNVGSQLAKAPVILPNVWQLSFLQNVDLPLDSIAWQILAGALFFAPLLITSLIVSRLWAETFARMRGRPLDTGWIYAAWLYTLLLPATMPLYFAALGLTFGLIFGCHVFGGTGRYIVNPALLGIVFLLVAYPDLLGNSNWLPGVDAPSTWAAVATESVATGGANDELAWLPVFLGQQVGAMGTGSAAACLLGALILIISGVASIRMVAAGVVSIGLLAGLTEGLNGLWHLVLGNFAFCLAFVATDPTIRPQTKAGNWAFGVLFGCLVLAIRTANPQHPEGSLFALLLASLCIPLLDYVANLALQRSGKKTTKLHG